MCFSTMTQKTGSNAREREERYGRLCVPFPGHPGNRDFISTTGFALSVPDGMLLFAW